MVIKVGTLCSVMLFIMISYINLVKDITKTGRFRMMLFLRQGFSKIILYGETWYIHIKNK